MMENDLVLHTKIVDDLVLHTRLVHTSPYSSHPFYLEDLWFYNFTSGLWRQVLYDGK
jgi:hypothetical protein